MNPNKKRLRRTMMFLNAQKPGLIKDPYIYKPDSIMLSLCGRDAKVCGRNRTHSVEELQRKVREILVQWKAGQK